MRCISVKIMVISVRQKNVFYSQSFLKMRKFLLDMRKDFLIMSNFYLVEILSEPNSLTKWQVIMCLFWVFFFSSRIWQNLKFLFRFDFFSSDCEFKGTRLQFTRFWGPLECPGKEFVLASYFSTSASFLTGGYGPDLSARRSMLHVFWLLAFIMFDLCVFRFPPSTAFIMTPSLESLPNMA